MPRLFISPKEINFINDLAKELIKDVIGQKVYLFQISATKSKVHDVYEESPDKVFESPIELECLVKYNGQEITTNRFGSEEYYTIELYIQTRDLIDKGIEILEGDFFSYGSVFFEIIKAPVSDTIMGQIENKRFITVSGRQSRKDQFLAKVFGPTSEEYSDPDAVQDTFVQQRGFEKNRLGETADVRSMQKNGILDKPISEPREVSPFGDPKSSESSFYDKD